MRVSWGSALVFFGLCQPREGEGERPEGEPWRAVRAGGKQRGHSWLPGLQVNVAIIMSIKTNKFKMYEEREREEANIAKALAVSVSIATCILTLSSMGPGLGREKGPHS